MLLHIGCICAVLHVTRRLIGGVGCITLAEPLPLAELLKLGIQDQRAKGGTLNRDPYSLMGYIMGN